MRYWTDGAATMRKDANGNYVREAGGWSFCYESECGKLKGYYGGLPQTTNNEMELTAIYHALDAAATIPDFDIRIISDSAYCINGITNWRYNWKRNGWWRDAAHKQELKNRDLWMRLDAIIDMSYMDFIKVSGHSGVKWNEYVDKRAVAFTK